MNSSRSGQVRGCNTAVVRPLNAASLSRPYVRVTGRRIAVDCQRVPVSARSPTEP
jgi:hypothetical protein